MRDEEKAPQTPDGEAHQRVSGPVDRSSAQRAMAKIIGERLRIARLAARMTRQELAGETFSESSISAIERGKMTPSLPALNVLANRLELATSYFLGDGELFPASLIARLMAFHLPLERDHAARQMDLMLALDKAKELIRQDQYEEALNTIGQGDEPPADLPVRHEPIWYCLAGWALTMLGRFQGGIELLERGLSLAEWLHFHARPDQQASQAELVERLRCYLGVAYCSQGKTQLALDCHRRGLQAILARVICDAELKVTIYKGLGNEMFALGKYGGAIGYYKQAIKEARYSHTPRQEGLAYWGLAVTYQQKNDLLKARRSYQGALGSVNK